MPRYKVILEYDGGPYSGWQRQENGPSVQGALEAAITGFCGEAVTVFAAGRTDAGVHALGQVVSFDLAEPRRTDTIRDAINHHLRPAPIAVLSAEEVAEEFHARFSATYRRYLYRIVNRRAPLTVERGRAWRVPQALDADAMHHAAQVLVGEHDFTTFRAAECQSKSPVKTLTELRVSRAGEELSVTARAPSFLHHQVRSFVGSLVQVGIGRWTDADLAAALRARRRSACGPVAPADGLYLIGVAYP